MMIRRNPPPGSEPPPSNIQKLILSSCEAQVALSLTVTCLDISSSVTTLTSLLLLDETQEQNSRALEKPDGDAKKARFGGLLKASYSFRIPFNLFCRIRDLAEKR